MPVPLHPKTKGQGFFMDLSICIKSAKRNLLIVAIAIAASVFVNTTAHAQTPAQWEELKGDINLFLANDLGVAFANYGLDTNRLDNANYDEAWDFTAKSLPEGATDGASLTSIVKTSLTIGGKTYAAQAPQKFFGARK